MSSTPTLFWHAYAALAALGVGYTYDEPFDLKECLAIGIAACVGAVIFDGHASELTQSFAAIAVVTAPVVAARWVFSKLHKR